jgi:hypothetical protein
MLEDINNIKVNKQKDNIKKRKLYSEANGSSKFAVS